MRLSSKEYILEDFDFNTISEVYLLKRFQGTLIPGAAQINAVKAMQLSLNKGHFEIEEYTSLSPVQIFVHQHRGQLRISCTCDSNSSTLCIHEYATLRALQKKLNYKVFFDYTSRQLFLRTQSTPYGLENENDIEQYFELKYEDNTLMVSPSNPSLVSSDPTLSKQITNETRRETDIKLLQSSPTSQRVLIISRHKFYDQLRFELTDTNIAKNGNLKSPFFPVDVISLLWKTQNIKEVKFYTALNNCTQNDPDTDPFSYLQALRVIQENPLNFPVYLHNREITDKITTRSLSSIHIHLLSGQIEISVVKKMPFYEIQVYFIHDGKRKNIHDLDIKYRYFIRSEDRYYLIDKLIILNTIEYFRGKPAKLLIHHTKYDEFLQSTLLPLEEYLVIKYKYIRKATESEKKILADDQEQIIYFSQQDHYVNITPTMRYGDVEVPLYSKRAIKMVDANGNLFELKRNKIQEEVFLSRVCRMHSAFMEQLAESRYFYLHYQQFLQEDWFLDTIDCWKNQGITLLGFQELEFTNRNLNKATISIEILSGTKWFETKFHLQYGDQFASIKQLHKAIRNKSKYIALDDGTAGLIPQEWFQKITQYFNLGIVKHEQLLVSKIAFRELAKLAKKDLVSDKIITELNTYHQAVDNLKEIQLLVPPKDLKTTLRKYQLEGLSWLVQLDKLDFGGCLADDMGLGKTVQIIAFLLYQKENHIAATNLIICPTSLVFNWHQEIKKFAPTLNVLILHGNDRQSKFSNLDEYDVVITTYGLMVSEINVLKRFDFNCIILDESQAIKNPNSERNKMAKQLQARTRYILTGTPIENNTLDIFAQLSFACPGLLGTKQFFKDTFATPIDRFQDKKRLKSLHRKIEPFILRRTKRQVANDLPIKTEITILCEMGEAQRSVYESHQTALRDYLERTQDEDFSQHSMHMLAGLTRLRQICNAPYLIKDGYDKTISCKIDALIEQLDSISADHKILIFSQFVGMLELVKGALDIRKIPYEILTGSTKDRGAVVKNFNENSSIRVFLISLKAGGTGLNLTAADYVFLMDPWWNPATENQAIDRSHRLGQDKNVVAIRFICPDTIEEKIKSLQDKKSQLATDLIKPENFLLQQVNRKTWIELLN